jgi:hypothetical protein
MRQLIIRLLCCTALACGSAVWAQGPFVRTTYHVRQIAAGAAYLDGGTGDGLAEGMRLTVTRLAPGQAKMSAKEIGKLTITAVATISAVCEVGDASGPIEVGDIAELSQEDTQAIQEIRSSKSVRHVAQIVAFTEGDPVDQELRDYTPRPPSPEVNRIRGRVSFEEDVIADHTSGMKTFQEGVVLRADMTRIGGSYWNFTGYWQGRITAQSGAPQVTTLNELLNRTYQLGLYYNNPNSRYVFGGGRFLLPWAPSLSTIDGGYAARRLGKNFTTGVFAGSTPNPTAWNYDPNRQMFGTFVAYQHGSYEGMHYSSTAGAAITRSHWKPERQFLFFENTISKGTRFSIYHDLEVDRLASPLTSDGRNPVRLARSFLSVRIQLLKSLSVDFGHNFFRDVPTFDTRLLGTGLLDQFLFQGFSAGLRWKLNSIASVYANLGGGKRNGDQNTALNYSGGVTLNRGFLPFQIDLRYSRFNSAFGNGSFDSVSLTRQFGDKIHFNLLGGYQTLTSTFTNQTNAKYGTASIDYLIGKHYILGAGWTVYRGGAENYDQSFINFGYRF